MFKTREGVKKKFNPEKIESTWIEESSGKEYTTEEALEQGLIRKEYYYIDKQVVDYRNVDVDTEMKAGNISGAQWRIIPMTDKYDNIIKLSKKEEIDGKSYSIVECSNNIYISNDIRKIDGTSKSR